MNLNGKRMAGKFGNNRDEFSFITVMSTALFNINNKPGFVNASFAFYKWKKIEIN